VFYESKPIEGEYSESVHLTTILKDQSFLLYLQCAFPAIQIHRRYNGGPIENASSFETWMIDLQEQTSITVQTERIQTRGDGLWEKVQQAWFRWEERKRPARETYRILVTPQDVTTICFPSE
jgi:hypothetical protein